MDIEPLPRDVSPDARLEERTVARLRAGGLLVRPARRPWWQLAAAVAIFAAGALSGASWAGVDDASGAGQPRYLLLLHGGIAGDAAEEARAVDAYRAWAMQLHAAGRYVDGERLADTAVTVPAGDPGNDAPQGYFVVSAASLDDAVSVASSTPHVARGGRIVVRPIDTP
jgi:hypothetical protein